MRFKKVSEVHLLIQNKQKSYEEMKMHISCLSAVQSLQFLNFFTSLKKWEVYNVPFSLYCLSETVIVESKCHSQKL